MNDFHPISLFAIAQEFLGFWLYVGIAGLVLVVLLYGLALMRGLRLRGAPVKLAALVGAVVGIAAMVLAPALTVAGFQHLLTAVDYVMLFFIGLGAFAAATIALTPLAALAVNVPKRHKVALTS